MVAYIMLYKQYELFKNFVLILCNKHLFIDLTIDIGIMFYYNTTIIIRYYIRFCLIISDSIKYSGIFLLLFGIIKFLGG